MKDSARSVREKQWYEVSVDGKIIAVIEEGSSTTREIARIGTLMGVEVRNASPESLMRFGSKTVIPATVLRKFEEAANLAARKRRLGWQSNNHPGNREEEDD